jgi:hypothetical protein
LRSASAPSASATCELLVLVAAGEDDRSPGEGVDLPAHAHLLCKRGGGLVLGQGVVPRAGPDLGVGRVEVREHEHELHPQPLVGLVLGVVEAVEAGEGPRRG